MKALILCLFFLSSTIFADFDKSMPNCYSLDKDGNQVGKKSTSDISAVSKLSKEPYGTYSVICPIEITTYPREEVVIPVEPNDRVFPDATTTGVTDESLLVSSGQIKSSSDGQIIENCDTNYIYISHKNVTIRNCRINATAFYGLDNRYGENLTVEDVEIFGASSACILSTNGLKATFSRLHVHDCSDGIKLGSNTTLLDSYIHDYITTDASHNDAVQIRGGSNIVISGNRIDGPYQSQTSAIIVEASTSAIDNISITRNRLSGGAYTVYMRNAGKGVPTNISITGNVWESDSWLFGEFSFSAPITPWIWNNNTYPDGSVYNSPF